VEEIFTGGSELVAREAVVKYSVSRLVAYLAALLAAGGMTSLHAQDAQTHSQPQHPSNPSAIRRTTRDLAEDKPGHTHYLDYKNGFRGVRFGTSIDTFKDLVLNMDTGTVKKYTKKDDDLSIGGFKVTEILYQFFDGKFQGVSISASNGEAENLLNVFQAAFGPGAHPKGISSQYFWVGKTANANIITDQQGRARAWIGNNELQKEFDKAFAQMLSIAAEQL
jgi:hypothetical protein